jgi:hypothetical protein
MNQQSILDMALNYELTDKKYYFTLAGKKLKTKKGNYIFSDSIVIVNKVIDDYSVFKFKSKWINLVSSFVDFFNNEIDIEESKKQLLSYFKTDFLFYLDNKDDIDYEVFINNFKLLIDCKEDIYLTSHFEKTDISNKTLDLFNLHIAKLLNRDLFVSLFLTRISTSSILTLLYLAKNISAETFYKTAFYAELNKLEKSPDAEEQNRLKIIKDELEIINYFCRNGLNISK